VKEFIKNEKETLTSHCKTRTHCISGHSKAENRGSMLSREYMFAAEAAHERKAFHDK
jgi:hypothetical protein